MKDDIAQSDFPLEASLGYQIRAAHRNYQTYLMSKIEPHGVTMGMWYFLRVLWQKDGLTQRELSRRVGTMEPTTLAALKSMEKIGFVQRARDPKDQRKMIVCLTPKGHGLRDKLSRYDRPGDEDAAMGLSGEEHEVLRNLLVRVRQSMDRQRQGSGSALVSAAN
ncbi:MarR family winged helix-turn-helix transcriptional regulator [Brevirhabdus sp.]|uniref:MarR family winged helix-turn-helix transcriptional regulator n=1 Tax=Brevirhabdus sp. TaxID=2004514 RepID=UPI004059139E